MVVRLIMMNFGPGKRSEAEKVADTFAGIYKTMKGFKGSTFFGEWETGECGALSQWESKEDADAASASMKPKLQEVAGGILKGPPTVKTFELYGPKV
jgi:heme-degrading monooxygenase HmoA